MGYTTDFSGEFEVTPPLNAQEIEFLNAFSATRRMDREQGPYFVDIGDDEEVGVRDYNRPPEGQPGLWCQWVPSEGGEFIDWDQDEKFYKAAEWIEYIIQHFLKPGAHAKSELPFLQDHVVNGVVHVQGEDPDDRWAIRVVNNVVFVLSGEIITYETQDRLTPLPTMVIA